MDKPDGEIMRSLNRNHTRKEVLRYLADIGDSTAYLTEISTELDKHVSAVYRAMNTYGETKGLKDLGLVEKDREFYRLSERGKEIVRYIKQAPKARDGAQINQGHKEEKDNDGI